MIRRTWAFLGVFCIAAAMQMSAVAAHSTPAPQSKPAAKQINRLPPHYAKVVDQEQRQRIYSIQAKYADQIEELERQLKQLIDKRDAEIRAVLSEEQQKQLDERLAAAKKSRARKKAGPNKDAVSEPDGSTKK